MRTCAHATQPRRPALYAIILLDRLRACAYAHVRAGASSRFSRIGIPPAGRRHVVATARADTLEVRRGLRIEHQEGPALKTKSEHRLAVDTSAYASVDPEGVYSAILAEYPPIMTTGEVAEFLRCDTKTVANLCRSGIIPDVPMPPEGVRLKWTIPKLCLIKYLVGNSTPCGGKEDGDE